MKSIIPFSLLCGLIVLGMYSQGWRFYSPEEVARIDCDRSFDCLVAQAAVYHPKHRRNQ